MKKQCFSLIPTIMNSNSPWRSRMVPVTKLDGLLRMCINFRALINITIKDKYPLPRVDEILDKLAGAINSNLVATFEHYQIALAEKDKSKAAFA